MSGIAFGNGTGNLIVNFANRTGDSLLHASRVQDALSTKGLCGDFVLSAGAAKIAHPKGNLTVDKAVFSAPTNKQTVNTVQDALRKLGLAVETITGGKNRKNKSPELLVR